MRQLTTTRPRKQPVPRADRLRPLAQALLELQPATVQDLYEVVRGRHPKLFRTRRDVYNTLRHFDGGQYAHPGDPVWFEEVSAGREGQWTLTEDTKRMLLADGVPEHRTPEQLSGGAAQSRVYERGQTVVPKRIRDAMGIEEGSMLVWELRNGIARVFGIPRDPIRASRGILKDTGYTFAEFIADRNDERALERARDAREERKWRTSSIRPPS
jgi:AbrB family looped-hinge helix DNA binding protein